MGCTGSKSAASKSFCQSMVILRHSERADQVDPAYLETAEHKARPFDSPLTENGIKLAQDVALELLEKQPKAKFSMIVSSPYRRCMQTAAEVAKVLKLPVLLDQEIGEVWDKTMPSDGPPHRSPLELVALAKELGIEVKNPLLEDGGFKLFGKRPVKYPEELKDGHLRLLVRIEHYILESQLNEANFIIVSHAPAVAAMMNIFERGMCDLEKLEYCAMVSATRGPICNSQAASEKEREESVFAQQWTVETKRLASGLNLDGCEEDFQEEIKDTLRMVKERLGRATISESELTKIIKASNNQV